MVSAKIKLPGNTFVIVEESSGVITPYKGWEDFFKRPDADQLCQEYLERNQRLTKLVATKMMFN